MNGRKVIILTHSEGSNINYKLMNTLSEEEKQYVGFLNIAPTRNEQGPGSFDYVLSPKDDVIAAIKSNVGNSGLTLTEPLPPKGANISFPLNLDFAAHHELLAYFNYLGIFNITIALGNIQ